MTDDQTLHPSAAPQQERQLLREEPTDTLQAAQTQPMQAAQTICPHCQTANDADAMFCASCGHQLRNAQCPYCGSEVEPDTDFCEVCHHYFRNDVCSFCGAAISPEDVFCPECGSPRNGITCPTCGKINTFAFCTQCNTPLTYEAQTLLQQMRHAPQYKEMTKLAKELAEMNMLMPLESKQDEEQEKGNDAFRERVLMLLAQDAGVEEPLIPERKNKRPSRQELDAMKNKAMNKLTEILESMAAQPQPSPAKARNYAMATKPQGVRLVWECNFKHALHSGPCGCAKPQMGGKWIILGNNSQRQIKDDI